MEKSVKKTVFLFGAGASAGCGNIYPKNPPVGKQLYKDLCIKFPDSWGSLSADLRIFFENNFEEGMDFLWKTYPDKSSLLLQQVGIYFCEFVPTSGSETLYKKLIIKLGNLNLSSKDVIFSTLNYDCLIDGELTAAGIDINYLFSSDRPEGMPFIKLHGSCNWFLDFPIGRNVHFTHTTRLKASVYSLNGEELVKKYLIGDTSLYPVMRLYTKEKPAQLAPDFFEHLDKQWSEIVMNAEKIIIIGVAPYPDDKHVWDPLAKTKANIFYIGNKEKYEKWHLDSGRIASTTFIDTTFNGGFDLLIRKLFD